MDREKKYYHKQIKQLGLQLKAMLLSRPLLTRLEKLVPDIPLTFMMVIGLPILRQKMAQSGGMTFIDLPDGCCYGDLNTWKRFPVSEQKITLNNQIMNNRMKCSNRTNRKQKQKQLSRIKQM
jgi:hypothetical protein